MLKDEQRRRTRAGALAAGLGLLAPALALAQEPPAPAPLVCASKTGERQHCAADTSAGVVLATLYRRREACLLGKTWGYDDDGVWVFDGCTAEFIVAGSPEAGAVPAAEEVAEPTQGNGGHFRS